MSPLEQLQQHFRAACLQNETTPEKLLNRYEKRFEKHEKGSEKRSETRPIILKPLSGRLKILHRHFSTNVKSFSPPQICTRKKNIHREALQGWPRQNISPKGEGLLSQSASRGFCGSSKCPNLSYLLEIRSLRVVFKFSCCGSNISGEYLTKRHKNAQTTRSN